jgi:hypothetical protein
MQTATPARVFKCVPIENSWTIQGTKLDLKAIYRRPRRRVGEYDEIIPEHGPDGLPLYDLTGPLPLRRHADWIAKGFEYVTVVASPRNDDGAWPAIAASLRAKNLNPADYLQHPHFGTWNPKLYLATADQVEASKVSELQALVEQLGSEAVLAVRRSMDPSFTLPAKLQHIPPGGRVAKTAASASPAEAALDVAGLPNGGGKPKPAPKANPKSKPAGEVPA